MAEAAAAVAVEFKAIETGGKGKRLYGEDQEEDVDCDGDGDDDDDDDNDDQHIEQTNNVGEVTIRGLQSCNSGPACCCFYIIVDGQQACQASLQACLCSTKRSSWLKIVVVVVF